MAKNDFDVVAPTPAGPRLIVDAGNAAAGTATPSAAPSPAATPLALKVVSPPKAEKLGNYDWVLITTSDTRDGKNIVTETAVVRGPKQGYLLTSEAPADQWDASLPVFHSVYASARIGA